MTGCPCGLEWLHQPESGCWVSASAHDPGVSRPMAGGWTGVVSCSLAARPILICNTSCPQHRLDACKDHVPNAMMTADDVHK